MMMVVDQLSREVVLPSAPKRIISTVPSQTELLFYLGLESEIVGVTSYCTHPAPAVQTKTKVGGTKQLDISLIRSLNPDLIIANKEENERTQITTLINNGIPVYISDPADLRSALAMISDIGLLTGKHQQADELAANIDDLFAHVSLLHPTLSVVYLIWRKPYMAVGKGTFINDMLGRCRFVNVITTDRYPQLTPQMLREANPDLVLLSSEPYPFRQKHIREFQNILPDARIELVDGEMFSWYGSRLLLSPGYLGRLTERLNTSQ